MWIQTLTFYVDQGLWIQVSCLHCFSAKAASIGECVYDLWSLGLF